MPLHVEPDELRLSGRNMVNRTWDILDMLDVLRSGAYRLESTWSGTSAEDLCLDLRMIISRLSAEADQLHTLGLVLLRQADAWDEVDHRWAALFGRSPE
jgi:uncharacterized protein YukE